MLTINTHEYLFTQIIKKFIFRRKSKKRKLIFIVDGKRNTKKKNVKLNIPSVVDLSNQGIRVESMKFLIYECPMVINHVKKTC